MADPLLSRLLRITAMHPPRAQRKSPELAPAPAPRHTYASGSASYLPAPDRRFHALPFDRKRAAAGDRDDD